MENRNTFRALYKNDVQSEIIQWNLYEEEFKQALAMVGESIEKCLASIFDKR
jgi:hypothetical protein